MRSLMGKLNKFALAPGSLSDIGIGGDTKPKAPVTESTPTPPAEKPAAKKALAPKKKEEAPATDSTSDDQTASKDTDADASASSGAASDDTNVEIQQDEQQI